MYLIDNNEIAKYAYNEIYFLFEKKHYLLDFESQISTLQKNFLKKRSVKPVVELTSTLGFTLHILNNRARSNNADKLL